MIFCQRFLFYNTPGLILGQPGSEWDSFTTQEVRGCKTRIIPRAISEAEERLKGEITSEVSYEEGITPEEEISKEMKPFMDLCRRLTEEKWRFFDLPLDMWFTLVYLGITWKPQAKEAIWKQKWSWLRGFRFI